MAEAPLELEPLILLAIVAAGGAFGGLCDLLRNLGLRDRALLLDGEGFHISHILLLALGSVAVGAAGAIALQFIFILLQSFKSTGTTMNVVFLFSVSVAAGFGARRLLPIMTSRLEDQIKKVKEEADEASEKADEASEKANAAYENVRFFTRLHASLRGEAPESEQQWCIDHLTVHLKSDPVNRTAAIYLGRLYRMRKQYDKSIEVLTGFLSEKSKLGQIDKDYADVLYNKACYEALMASEGHDEHMKELAIVDLRRSVEISEVNRDDARTDRDFSSLREDPRFLEMLEEKGS